MDDFAPSTFFSCLRSVFLLWTVHLSLCAARRRGRGRISWLARLLWVEIDSLNLQYSLTVVSATRPFNSMLQEYSWKVVVNR